MLTGAPLMVVYKKVFDVTLHLEAEWPSKQNIQARSQVSTFGGWGKNVYLFLSYV